MSNIIDVFVKMIVDALSSTDIKFERKNGQSKANIKSDKFNINYNEDSSHDRKRKTRKRKKNNKQDS